MSLEAFFQQFEGSFVGAASLTPLPLDAWRRAAEQLGQTSLWVHLDIMDGLFTPRLGAPVTEMLWLNSPGIGPVDIHLMVQDPNAWLPDVLALHPARVTVHVESCDDAVSLSDRVRASNASPWLAINPNTDCKVLEQVLPHFDGVLVLLIPPGTSNAADLSLRSRVAQLSSMATVGVDGGVNSANAGDWISAGASYLVVGRALFPDIEAPSTCACS